MKSKLLLSIISVFALLLLSSSTHPIKLTSSEIKYDEKTNSLSMECKVFIDDFAPAINPSLLSRINTSSLSDDDILQIEYYFLMKYKIYINSKKIPLKIKSYTVQNNVLSLEFSENQITLKKGDELYIENELLFEVFGPIQSNWLTLKMPPFIPNYNLESKFRNYIYSQTL